LKALVNEWRWNKMNDKVNKLTPHTDGKKRKMIMKTLSAVALTGRGANPEANVTFYKSFNKPTGEQVNKDESVEKRLILSEASEGHSHLININDYVNMQMGGDTGWTMGHDHPFVIDDLGNVTIGESHGHSHAYLTNISDLMKADETAGNGNLSKKESNMDKKDKAVDYSVEVGALKTALALAVAMGTLTDAHKAHYNALDEDAKEGFLAKTKDGREAVMTAIKSENPEVYKSNDGTVFYKSDDPRFVKMAKENDANKAALVKAQDETKELSFKKRATDEFSNLPGKVETHVALIKAVDAIEDKEVRDAVEATLKAHNDSMNSIYKVAGTTEVSKEADNAVDEMDRLTKAHVKANPEVGYFDAYDIISKAHPELYTEAVKG